MSVRAVSTKNIALGIIVSGALAAIGLVFMRRPFGVRCVGAVLIPPKLYGRVEGLLNRICRITRSDIERARRAYREGGDWRSILDEIERKTRINIYFNRPYKYPSLVLDPEDPELVGVLYIDEGYSMDICFFMIECSE